MSRNLYALLVGINQYHPGSRVPHLKGCVNDILGMQAYLEGRLSTDGFHLQMQTLLDEQATRQNIIDGFRQHLSRAKSDDVVLFYYAGHGAQASAPEAFWPVSPSRMMETLVCYDSRIDRDHWDLADKELAQLISEVARSQPHITVVLDCCHSGSGTRAIVGTRRAEPDVRERPLESFLVTVEEAITIEQQAQQQQKQQSNTSATRSLSPAGMQLPAGRHVVLAACQNIEEAKEYLGSGQPRGAFSYFLQDSLNKSSGRLSYRDLFKQTSALIHSNTPAQSPQLDATHAEDLEQLFLGGAIAATTPYFTLSHHPDHGWIIDGGAIHGLQRPTATETTLLEIFSLETIPEQHSETSAAITQASITQVLPQRSKIKIENPLDSADTYKAVVISSPLPPLQVFVEGNEASVEALKHAIATTGPNGQASLYVQSVDQLAGADLKIIATEQRYQIASVTDDRPLVTAISGESYIRKTVQNLEHIARWRAIADLASPPSSQIQGDIALKIYTGTEPSHETSTEITDPCVRLSYTYSDRHQAWHKPLFRLKLSNNSNKTLHCALLYLNQQYKVDVIKPDGVNSLMRLLPGQDLWFANGAALNGEVADALWEQGFTEAQDQLKLVACTEEFDPSLMTLKALGQPMGTIGSRDLGNTRGLNRLMARLTDREITAKEITTKPTEQQTTRDIGLAQSPQLYTDWATTQTVFTFVRPQPSTPVNSKRSIAISNTLTVAPHDQLSANIRLTTVAQSTRDIGSHILPPLLQAKTEPFQFSQSRASDPGLSALELSNVQNPDAVTTENPLRLTTDIPLNTHEYILPIAYDGEFYLPLGYGKTAAGKTQIVIERLTDPISEGNRSVTGSIRIFFQKVVSKKLGERLSQKVGLHFDYPLLASATLSYPVSKNPIRNARESTKAQASVTYSQDVEQLRAKVAEAQTIALYIHGIFGDTESMLPSLDTAVATLGDKATPIGKIYDLVLAFDYENLNTSIDQNARLLKSRLEAIGLGKGHGKTLHIIAHSMGGLVSRWFIEQEGGKAIVDHLIMLGTPNNGSPWPQVQAGITTAVSFAINGLSLVAAPLKILEGLLSRIETIDVSLDQMQPGSDFLAEIASAPDPKVPYTLVVGNTSLIGKNESAGLKQRLVQRLWKAAELPFFNQPNDIAVSVDSIVSIPAGRSPQPKLIPTACNHLEYFINSHGLASLTAAVVGTGVTPNSLISELTEPTEPTDESAIRKTETQTSSHPPQKGSAANWVGLVALLSIGMGAIFLFTQHSKPGPTPTSPITQPD